MNKFFRGFDRVLNVFIIIAGVLLLYMMLSVCWDVLVRYAFNRPSIWIIDAAGYGQLFLCFLIAAWVLKKDGHVRIDLVFNTLSPRGQLWLNGIMSIIAAIAFLVITGFGAQNELVLFQTKLIYNSVILPLKYPIYFIIPLGSLLVSIQLIRIAINCFTKLKEPPPRVETTRRIFAE